MNLQSKICDPSGRSSATATVHIGDCLETLKSLPPQSVHTCITSPPYFGLRSYLPEYHPDKAKEIGLEQTPEEFLAAMVAVFREVRRVLRDDGTLWLNLGDSYANGTRTSRDIDPKLPQRQQSHRPRDPEGVKPKDLIGIPWMVAFALRADGWYMRQDIIWNKPNPMPESVQDRCTKSHEYLFLLSKSPRYYFDIEAMKEPAVGNATGAAASFKRSGSKREQCIPGQVYGTHRPDREDVAYNETRNRRSVWSVATKPYSGAHFATFPPELIEPCVLAGCPEGGTVLDPFGGSGTTAGVSIAHGRNAVICELNPESVELMPARVLAIVCPDARVPESDPDATQAELFGADVWE